MKIGAKLKQERLKKSLTQENVANILNVSRQTISSWEVGRSYPDLESLVALSDLYNFSLDKLLREDSEMARKISNDSKIGNQVKKILVSVTILSILLAIFSAFKVYRFSENQDTTLDLIDNKINSLVINEIGDDSNVFEKELPKFLKEKSNDKTFNNLVKYLKIFTNAPNDIGDFNPTNMTLNYSYGKDNTRYVNGVGSLTKNKTKDGHKIYYEVGIDSKEFNVYDTVCLTSLTIGAISLILSIGTFIALNLKYKKS